MPGAARADQATDNNPPYIANVIVRHSITYPQFLRFRVGTTGGTINRIQFAPTAGQVGSGMPISGTGGELGSAANIEVFSNAGQITITPTNDSAGTGLASGANRISYTEISTTSSDATLPPPLLSDAGGTPVQVALNSGNITQRQAVWTYSYLNTTVPNPGSYGAAPGSGGGRVTYTASSP